MLRAFPAFVVWLLCGIAGTGFAFNGHVVTEGTITVEIGVMPVVTRYDAPLAVPVTLRNAGARPLTVQVTLTGLADEFRFPWQLGQSLVSLTPPS